MHLRIWIAAGVAVIAVIAALAATSAGSSSPYTQLQRPAALAPQLSPNRASVPNRVTLRLPVSGARVTVSFSMPSMNMWNGFSTTLTETSHGTYTAMVPVLGMPGSWRMQFHVAPRTGAPYTVTTNDGLY